MNFECYVICFDMVCLFEVFDVVVVDDDFV